MFEHKLNDCTVERFHQLVKYPLWTDEELTHIYDRIKDTKSEHVLIYFGLACWEICDPIDFEMNPDNWVPMK